MDLVSIVVTLLLIGLVGFIVYLIITYIPMPEAFKQVLVVACVILLVLFLIYIVSSHSLSISFHK